MDAYTSFANPRIFLQQSPHTPQLAGVVMQRITSLPHFDHTLDTWTLRIRRVTYSLLTWRNAYEAVFDIETKNVSVRQGPNNFQNDNDNVNYRYRTEK